MMHFQSMEEVLAAIKRRFWLIALVMVIGCAVSVYLALNQSRVFEATAVVQIEDAQVSAASETEARDGLDARRTVRLIEQRIMARSTLLEIMETYDLFTEDPNMSVTDRIIEMRQSVSIEAILSGESWQPDASASGLVINVQLGDAQKTADVANDILDRVLQEARTRSVDRAQVELSFFDTEEARIRESITAAEQRIAAFKAQNAEFLPAGITGLQSELTTLNASQLALRQQILGLQSNSSRVRADDLQRQVSVLEDQIALVSERIDEINASLAQAPVVERELSALERELAQLNEQFTVIARRKADAEMSQSLEEQRQLARFEVLERAIVPDYPISRSRKQAAIMGAVASGLLGLGLAFVIELMNPAIRNAAQMERMLGVRPVISVPTLNGKSGGKKSRGKRAFKFGLGALLALILGGLAIAARTAADKFGGLPSLQEQGQ